MHYYNENDPRAAAWLRELIKARLIPEGIVDERSIADVRPSELAEYTQCHFFAGIGGWSYALGLAQWPEDVSVWTGSCPCQPFSVAGKGKGTADERHFWPEFNRLIAECKPATVFGEQVASAAGRVWLAGVRTDLEALGYGVGAADLCAAGVSAPHVRQRLYWVAHTLCKQTHLQHQIARGFSEQQKAALDARREALRPEDRSPDNNDNSRCGSLYHGHWWSGPMQVGRNCIAGEITRSGRKHSAQWRIESGTFPLAHGIPCRVGLLRGYGNAIVPQLAAEFIQACEEARRDLA